MGKRIRAQRIGRGSPTYKSKSWRRVGKASLPPLSNETLVGEVLDILHNPGLATPYAKIRLSNGTEFWIPACEGMRVGQNIMVGPQAPPQPGNILPLSLIPDGTKVYMLESKPGDGGKFVRASGESAIIVGRNGGVIVELPSRKTRAFDPNCRAIIGVVAGGGRVEKPFVKAGKKFHWMRAKGKLYPRVRGVAMNIVDHPFGGGRKKHAGRPKVVARGAPPGQKVGLIAARRTGVRK